MGDVIILADTIISLRKHYGSNINFSIILLIQNKELYELFLKDHGINAIYVTRNYGLKDTNEDVDIIANKIFKKIKFDQILVLRRFLTESTCNLISKFDSEILIPNSDDFKKYKKRFSYKNNIKPINISANKIHELEYLNNFIRINFPKLIFKKYINLKENFQKKNKVISICLSGRSWFFLKWYYLIIRFIILGYEINLIGQGVSLNRKFFIFKLFKSINYYINSINLTEIITLLYKSDFYIGNDTGISHLSSNILKKVFIIHGGGGLLRWFPWPNSRNQVIFYYLLGCFDCRWLCKFKNVNKYKCIRSIDHKYVFNKIINLAYKDLNNTIVINTNKNNLLNYEII